MRYAIITHTVCYRKQRAVVLLKTVQEFEYVELAGPRTRSSTPRYWYLKWLTLALLREQLNAGADQLPHNVQHSTGLPASRAVIEAKQSTTMVRRVMTNDGKTQANRVDRLMNGACSAFWHGQIAYENGRVKHFETESEAWEFLSRCDAAGKIIH